MPKSGALTLSDLLIDGNERVGFACAKCDRVGSYGLAGLISAYGADMRLADLLAEISADCPKRRGQGLDRCGAVYDFEMA